jgi:SAM-dependent MidA family methyltransferase
VPFDLVEAGAGNGRLSADILRAARRAHPLFYGRTRLHLVEASAAARAGQGEMLGVVADRLVASAASLPEQFEGALLANELLDALPPHQVIMRAEGLREVYVDVDSGRGDALVAREGPLSTPALAEYLDRAGVELETGWRVEINLRAVEWMRDAARRLRRGFVVIVDYGHPARELYSATHSAGTLTTFTSHTTAGPESSSSTPPWLQRPGDQDITAHVDFTSVQAAAEAEGLTTLGFLDQTYFLLGLMGAASEGQRAAHPAHMEKSFDLKKRLALKTLLMPGGLGSTHKVLILGKGVGTPPLVGCSYRVRVT